jgi:hypothetical protein
MLEFLQSYGSWIFIVLLFSLMLWGRARGHGMGCCGVGHQHQQEYEAVKNDGQTDHQSRGCH